MLNSITAMFDVVEAARRVRAATNLPLLKFQEELESLGSSLMALDSFEKGQPLNAKIVDSNHKGSVGQTNRKTLSGKNPKKIEAGKRAYATLLARRAEKAKASHPAATLASELPENNPALVSAMIELTQARHVESQPLPNHITKVRSKGLKGLGTKYRKKNK